LKISPYFFYTWAMPTDAVPTEDKYYRHSVVRWLVRDASFKQVEPTGEHLSQYRLSFGTCVRAAISAGFKHIFISPMVSRLFCGQNEWSGLGLGSSTPA
jgi:hypothetical protein